MKCGLLFVLSFHSLFIVTCMANGQNSSGLLSITRGIKTAAVAAVETLKDNVFPLTTLFNSDCVEPPKECPNSNVTFWLYPNPHNEIQLSVENLQFFNPSTVNINNPWKFIIHGYTKSKDEIPNPEIRSAYFRNGQYNLISVDYEPLARDKCYLASVNNVPLVANCTAQFIESLVERGFFRLEDLHVIGFSLGAQIAGQIHEYLNSGKPGRVTGLDPASPLFDGIINHELSHIAGDFVDIIHTNALAKGKLVPTGHVDFYVNGGSVQPGCFQNNNGSISTCNHDRSPIYFAESINSEKGFWGVPCLSYLKFVTGDCDTDQSHLVIMGSHTPKTARGIYFLQTSDKAPFALGSLIHAIPTFK